MKISQGSAEKFIQALFDGRIPYDHNPVLAGMLHRIAKITYPQKLDNILTFVGAAQVIGEFLGIDKALPDSEIIRIGTRIREAPISMLGPFQEDEPFLFKAATDLANKVGLNTPGGQQVMAGATAAYMISKSINEGNF